MPLPEPSLATPPNAVCSLCQRQVLLRRDGTFRAHTTRLRDGNLPWQVRCKGSGRVPQEA